MTKTGFIFLWYVLFRLKECSTTQHALADLGGRRARRMSPYGTQFFHFRIHFHQKVPMSEVHACPNRCTPPPTGNPGSATGMGSQILLFSCNMHLNIGDQTVYFYCKRPECYIQEMMSHPFICLPLPYMEGIVLICNIDLYCVIVIFNGHWWHVH